MKMTGTKLDRHNKGTDRQDEDEKKKETKKRKKKKRD